MNTSCMLIASILHQQFKSWTCQLCEAQMNPCKFNKKSLRAQMNLHSKAPAKDVYMKKKYGWKLAAKRVNTDWDNGTKPLLILYFEHVPFAQSILHLFCCSKEEQNKIPLRCHFVSQYQLKWRTMIWPKLPILFDCKKIVLTRNLNNCAPIPVYTVPTLTCKPFITPYKVLIRES